MCTSVNGEYYGSHDACLRIRIEFEINLNFVLNRVWARESLDSATGSPHFKTLLKNKENRSPTSGSMLCACDYPVCALCVLQAVCGHVNLLLALVVVSKNNQKIQDQKS